MNDPTDILYDTLQKKFPFALDTSDQDIIDSLEEIQKKSKTFPPEYKEMLSILRDHYDYIVSEKAHHAFVLGLDFGLSLMEELRPYPNIVM